ncbi:MAG: hypothetical protein M1827_003801 [Pycnora praestabilis]|nr:MAG: hypothetical protein M1827_003801 [Pycnora praestabilis]
MQLSILALFTAGLATLTSAYTTPVGDTPSGNPISAPGLNEIVPVGTPYSITWNPTTAGTVTLVLLRGPSTNILPLYPIVEQIPNTGVYVWTPDTSLQPDTTHYGIQLIVDATGQYQYTSQFGISNPSYSSTSSSAASTTSAISSSSASASASGSTTATTSSASSSTASASIVTSFTPLYPTSATPINSINATSTILNTTLITVPCPICSHSSTSSYAVITASTGAPVANSSIVQPSKTMSVPASLKTTAGSTATSAAAVATASSGAVASVARGCGTVLLGFGAVVALVLQ